MPQAPAPLGPGVSLQPVGGRPGTRRARLVLCPLRVSAQPLSVTEAPRIGRRPQMLSPPCADWRGRTLRPLRPGPEVPEQRGI